MSRQIKELLPDSWWDVARCVDEYEDALEGGYPNLRKLTTSVAPPNRPAACVELAAVDMEHRFRDGELVTVEHYLDELTEIPRDSEPVDELIAQEYELRRRRGKIRPSANTSSGSPNAISKPSWAVIPISPQLWIPEPNPTGSRRPHRSRRGSAGTKSWKRSARAPSAAFIAATMPD